MAVAGGDRSHLRDRDDQVQLAVFPFATGPAISEARKGKVESTKAGAK